MSVAYTTPQQVRDAVAMDPASGNDQASAAALSDAQLQEAIANASAQVDGALAVRYSLPLAEPIPPLVSSLATDIAAYLATLTWKRNRNTSATSPVQLRYDRAVGTDGKGGILGQLATGTMQLPNVGEGAPSAASAWNTSPDYFWLGNEWPYLPPWYGPTEADGAGGGSIATVAALAMDRVVLAREPGVLFEGAITRSVGGAPLSAAVRWPDGSPGVFSGTEDPGHPGKLLSWTLTYGQLPVINTYTQPPLTRDGAGNIVAQPAIAAT